MAKRARPGRHAAARRSELDADPSPGRSREDAFRARLRELGASDERTAELLASWSIVARGRGLGPADRRYWESAADWLLLRLNA